MKWIGILLIAIALNAAGIQIAACYKKRIAFWEQMEKMANRFSTEIRFTADSPERIFSRLACRAEEGAQTDCEPNAPFVKRFSETMRQMCEPLRLPSAEWEAVQAFGEGLGTTDLEGQLGHCACYSRVFSEKADCARETYRTKGKLSRSLCLLASAAIVIVLI